MYQRESYPCVRLRLGRVCKINCVKLHRLVLSELWVLYDGKQAGRL